MGENILNHGSYIFGAILGGAVLLQKGVGELKSGRMYAWETAGGTVNKTPTS